MLVLGNIIRNMKLVKIRVYKIVYPFFIDLCILGVSVTKLRHNCKLLTV